MTVDELKEILISEGLYPIHTKHDKDDFETGSHTGLGFVGDLKEYIQAVKVLGLAYVFVSNNTFEDGDFHYEIDDDEDDEYDDDDKSDDPADLQFFLPDIVPALNQFRKYVGQDCTFSLSVPTPSGNLGLLIEEPWWPNFSEMREEAEDKIEDDRGAGLEQKYAAKEAKEKDLLSQLRKLIKDDDFAVLPTQKAMRAYALEKIPGLESLDNRVLKDEIQEINAKIKAKGLGKKRKRK